MHSMHYIQKHILDKLRRTSAMRYVQLNPGEIESGHFRYHLMQLIKEGYVDSIERGLYTLTVSGQHAVDKLSENRVNATPMPKVITYTLLREGSKILLQQKSKQPYLNLLNMIGGKVHEDETTQAASMREVYEKTGIEISDPYLAGVFEILIKSYNNILTHAIAYVYVANINVSAHPVASLQVMDIPELNNTANLAPDFMPIFTKINGITSVQVDTIEIEIDNAR